MSQKAFFFDIDGTLYQNKFHEVSKKTIWALTRLLEQDHPVYLVSSRSVSEMEHLPESFINLLFTGLVLEGGALVLDERRLPVSEKTIQPNDMREIDTFCKDHKLTYRYSAQNGSYFGTPSTPEIYNHMFSLYMKAPAQKEYQDEEVYNVLIWVKDQALKQEILERFKDYSLVEYAECVELRNPDTSKEIEVEKICRNNRYEMSVAFGDGANDAGMLRLADLGVAMGNAFEPAKEAADLICKSVFEDGVADFLESRHWI
ncbi:Cof-type HAD-IIB family hydrolase [Ileibacterium valens]|uniref:Hydrolase n=1 Tax=Ileibacterium valens TaxID=1862668 RepID=A0A1U7NE27_9FIRM|nr:Cof-type HAD-IIB family hydrolase [Ileibacterium valens]OLU37747.1 hypothetical protein BO222_09850 [Ileibacterium valens]OLU42031.1 hypothetical protein BM735_03075 [Erysipelotrichaceae bacterium NYU-BL-F16]OLU43260.1 hypothetical protein BO224_00365 [Erysipelotrichaceae bacterium NYU-BL-E8]